MFHDGPDPNDPVYQVAARELLMRMREISAAERDRAGEVEESWPCEIRMLPATPDTAEGVLYMPRATAPVYIFQCTALESELGEYIPRVSVLSPLSPELLDLATDYHKRASQYVFTCTCGHVIPRIMAIPIGFIGEGAEEDEIDRFLNESDEELDATALQELIERQEAAYACPACGFKPNRRFD